MKREKTKDKNIFRMPSGVYYYRKGQKEISLKTTSFTEAVKKLNHLRAKSDPMLSSNLRLKFGHLVDDYLESRKLDVETNKIRQSTYDETYAMLGKHLEPYFRPYSVVKIRTDEWNAYLKKKSHLKDLTNHRKVLHHFMKWAYMRNYITSMPIFPLESPERRKRRILATDEISLIWQYAQGSLRLFISFALLNGMRRSEIIKLRWRCINFDNNSIMIESWTAKTGEGRIIPLAPATKALLLTRHAQAKLSEHEWVFPNAKDVTRHASVNGLKTAWATVKRKSGLAKVDITWHDLRATCEYYAHKRRDFTATQLEKFFGSSVDVQRKIYVSMDADDLRGLEKLFNIN